MKICCVELRVGAVLLLVVGGVGLLLPLLSSLFLTKMDPNSTKRELNLAGLLAQNCQRPLLTPCNVLGSKQQMKADETLQSSSYSDFF